MRRALAAMLLLAAPAQAAECWISYAGFEEKVPHLDLERCPDNAPGPQERFCRIMIHGGDVFIYAFRHDAQAGMPCLVRVDRLPFNDWVRARGPVNGAR